MKVDVTRKLVTFDGEEIRIVIQACPVCGRPVEDRGVRTLRNTCVDALLAQYRDELELSGTEKLVRHSLALRIHNEANPDLEAKEITLAKRLVGKMFGPLVVGQAWQMLGE